MKIKIATTRFSVGSPAPAPGESAENRKFFSAITSKFSLLTTTQLQTGSWPSLSWKSVLAAESGCRILGSPWPNYRAPPPPQPGEVSYQSLGIVLCCGSCLWNVENNCVYACKWKVFVRSLQLIFKCRSKHIIAHISQDDACISPAGLLVPGGHTPVCSASSRPRPRPRPGH